MQRQLPHGREGVDVPNRNMNVSFQPQKCGQFRREQRMTAEVQEEVLLGANLGHLQGFLPGSRDIPLKFRIGFFEFARA